MMIAPTTRTGAWRRWCILALACLVLAGCSRVTLFNSLDERQANEVMAVLLASGISVDKRNAIGSDSNYQIRVNQSDFPQAMQVLQARGLPRQRYVSICDVFQREGFVSSATEERARLQCSYEQALSRTLSSYSGVAEARVHVALPERDPIGGTAGNASASVVIFEQAGSNVRNEEHHFKVLVKDAVPGLTDPNQVSIKFNTVPGPGEVAVGQRSPAPVMSAMSPVTLAVVAGVIALLALIVTFGNRLRLRLQGQPKPDARVWKG